jgi:hypothetical protein
LLLHDYGISRAYTAEQVIKTIEREGLDVEFSSYAVAMYSDVIDFERFHRRFCESYNYDAMRTEVAFIYFDGRVDFTVSDIVASSSDTVADAADGASYHGNGGDNHGGYGL